MFPQSGLVTQSTFSPKLREQSAVRQWYVCVWNLWNWGVQKQSLQKLGLFWLLFLNDTQKDLNSSPGAGLMCWFSESQLITSVTLTVTDFLSSELRIVKREWNELKYCLKDDKNQWKAYKSHCSVHFKKSWILIKHSGQLLLLDIKWLSL